MNLADRIINLRNVKGISQQQLAADLDIKLARLKEIEETADATVKELVRISQYFGADFNWLIMGAAQSRIPFNYIVLIDSRAAAGYLENKDDPSYFSQLEYYRIPGFPDDGEYRLFKVHGDSMYPTLSENDHLVCSRVDNTDGLTAGDIVVLVTDSDIVVKRMRIDGHQYILESDNPKFKAFALNGNDARELWKVEAKVTRFVEQLNGSDGLDISSVADEVKTMRDQISKFKTELDDIKRELKSKNQ